MYEVRNVIFPEKKHGMKLELNLYYVKTCLDCGYSEFYLAKVVDKDEKTKEVPLPETEF